MADKQDSTVRLKDNRQIGYAEYGDPEGTPVLFFHGTPGSRKMRHPDESIAHSLQARIIALDRPGFGLSDPLPGRTFLDWPNDVEQVADHLQLKHFYIAAFSGGGPYALASAYVLKERVLSVSLMSSMGPLTAGLFQRWNWPIRMIFISGKLFPPLLKAASYYIIRKGTSNFDETFEKGVQKLPVCDRELILRPDIRAIFRESITEAFRQGNSGFVHEVGLLTRPWSFPLSEVKQKIHMWHGKMDPFHDGLSLHTGLPECHPNFFDEGHLVFFNHWREILAQMLKY